MGLRPVAAPSRRSRSRTLAPGLTILEVVLAVVMLGLVAAAVTSAISAIETMSARNRRVLAAHELANRLVLQWLDNRKDMPPSSRPLDYGPYSFMWDSQVDTVVMKINDTQRRVSGSTPQALDRFELFTVTIFDAEGEGPQYRPGPPIATLSRMYDIAAARNPESAQNIQDMEILQEIIRKIGGGASIPTPPPARNGGNR